MNNKNKKNKKTQKCVNCGQTVVDPKRDKGYCVECAYEAWGEK